MRRLDPGRDPPTRHREGPDGGIEEAHAQGQPARGEGHGAGIAGWPDAELPDAAAPECARHHRHRQGDLGRRAGQAFRRSRALPAGQRSARRHPGAGGGARGIAGGAGPGKIEIPPVELLRFHKPVAQAFAQLAPEDSAISRELPKELRTSDKDFAKGRLWSALRRVPDFDEFGDELWLIHQSGAIVRQVIQREGVKLLLEAREVTLFPAPTCD